MKKDYKYSINDVQSPNGLLEVYENEPEPVYYWRGIEDVSFGYVFGPSKAGKTIFCENFAMSLACGRELFFNTPMINKPKKILFAAMEENYRNRAKRMKKQLSKLSEEEKRLFNLNMKLAGKNFPRRLTTKEDWDNFEELIINENPDVLIIDSFTRIMSDDITNRMDCKKVLERLRNFAYDNSLCVMIIHHSTKVTGKPLVSDSMAGSSVLSQEGDFSIGLNRNELTNERYIKEVFFRYQEVSEMVTVYEICNDTNWLIPVDEKHESKIINDTGTNNASYYEMIINYLDSKSVEFTSVDKTTSSYPIQVSELKKKFVSTNTIPSRSFDYTLRKIVKNKLLVQNGAKGNYTYNLRN